MPYVNMHTCWVYVYMDKIKTSSQTNEKVNKNPSEILKKKTC